MFFLDDYLGTFTSGYEAVKQKTREELQIYWDRLLNSRFDSISKGTSSIWEIYLDISAPQIILRSVPGVQSRHDSRPQYISKKKSSEHKSSKHQIFPFVVIDLGRFKFTNVEDGDENTSSFHSKNNEVTKADDIEEDSDEDEEFLTPSSSPILEMPSISLLNSPRHSISGVSEPDVTEPKLSRGGSLSGDSALVGIRSKLYKKYKLQIMDVQVIVVDGRTSKDSTWRSASLRGTSLLHLVDRLSVNMEVWF